MTVREKLGSLGLVTAAPHGSPSGKPFPFVWVRVLGTRVWVSGHVPLEADGSLARPLGKVGAEVSAAEASLAARKAALAMLGSLERELGDLERITAWIRVLGFVNTAPGFTQIPAVVNGFSELVKELYGPVRGAHARSAVGVAELPFGVPVEVEAELEIAP